MDVPSTEVRMTSQTQPFGGAEGVRARTNASLTSATSRGGALRLPDRTKSYSCCEVGETLASQHAQVNQPSQYGQFYGIKQSSYVQMAGGRKRCRRRKHPCQRISAPAIDQQTGRDYRASQARLPALRAAYGHQGQRSLQKVAESRSGAI